MIYTRLSMTTVFLWPTVAIGITGEFWVELAWLGFAVGYTSEA